MFCVLACYTDVEFTHTDDIELLRYIIKYTMLKNRKQLIYTYHTQLV